MCVSAVVTSMEVQLRMYRTLRHWRVAANVSTRAAGLQRNPADTSCSGKDNLGMDGSSNCNSCFALACFSHVSDVLQQFLFPLKNNGKESFKDLIRSWRRWYNHISSIVHHRYSIAIWFLTSGFVSSRIQWCMARANSYRLFSSSTEGFNWITTKCQ